jgi:hypothetical protein
MPRRPERAHQQPAAQHLAYRQPRSVPPFDWPAARAQSAHAFYAVRRGGPATFTAESPQPAHDIFPAELDALAECHLGQRQKRHQPPRALGEMAYAVLAGGRKPDRRDRRAQSGARSLFAAVGRRRHRAGPDQRAPAAGVAAAGRGIDRTRAGSSPLMPRPDPVREQANRAVDEKDGTRRTAQSRTRQCSPMTPARRPAGIRTFGQSRSAVLAGSSSPE